MTQKRALDSLRACVKRGSNYLWHGHVGIGMLRPGADHELVERAMKIILPWSPAECLDRLPDEYAPIAWRTLAKATKDNAEAAFLVAYDPDRTPERLRAGSKWIKQLHMIDDKRNRHRVATLCGDKVAVAASRVAVIEHGVEPPQFLAILAHDGKPDSVDALVEVIHQATTAQDESLDALFEWFVPFARGTKMVTLAEELKASRDARGEASSVQELAARFGVEGKTRFKLELSIDSRQVQQGLTRKATAHVGLSSHALPNVDLMISRNLWNSVLTWYEDDTKRCDDNGLGKPASLDDIPRWVAASAKRLKVTWDRDTLRIQSTLRGKARQAAVDWFLGGS